MGMYTTLQLQVMLIDDPELKRVIHYLQNVNGDIETPDHPFFSCDRWWSVLRGSSAAVYSVCEFVQDEINEDEYILHVHSAIKNYHSEHEHFLDWLTPYVHKGQHDGEMCGYTRYESDRLPSLIFWTGNEFQVLPIHVVNQPH